MTSTKKRIQKSCSKCTILLTSKNWNNGDKKIKYYICKSCRKIKDKKYHNKDYAIKQRNRYRARKSAVILAYGNTCTKCGENEYAKLIMNKSNINYLYDNIVQKDGYQILCYNCSKPKLYKDKYFLKYKIQVINSYGGVCYKCQEDNIERLTLNYTKNYRWLIKNQFPTDLDIKVICYNCKHEPILEENVSELQALKY